MTYLDKLPHYSMSVGDVEDPENVYLTSLVYDPATGMKMQVFSNQNKQMNEDTNLKTSFAVMQPTNQYQRIISGVWMIPDVRYYREVKGYEFTVSFTKDDLEKALINYLKLGNADNFDIEHTGVQVSDLVSIEHWIIKDSNTLSPVMGYSMKDLGYDSLPVGTVMKTVYVKDEKFFNEFVLTGSITGFSIEGLFNLKEIQQFSMQQVRKQELFKQLGLVQSTGTIITKQGELKFSNDKITLNDEEVTDGEFDTESNFEILIKEGFLVEFGFNNEVVTVNEVPTAVTETPQTVNVESTVEVTPTVEVTVKEEERVSGDDVNKQVQPTENKPSDEELTNVIKELKNKVEELELKDRKREEEIAEAQKQAALKSPIPTNSTNSPTKPQVKVETITRVKNGVTYQIPKVR